MKITEKLKSKRILLWGYGLEGKSTEKFINKYCDVSELTVFQGKREDIDEDAYDYIIKSPGIVAWDLSDKFTSMTDLFLSEFLRFLWATSVCLRWTITAPSQMTPSLSSRCPAISSPMWEFRPI